MTKKIETISKKRKIAASSFRYLMGKLWMPTDNWDIIMYHRVINPEELPFSIQAGMYVRPDTFSMHVKFLKKNVRVIPLVELIQEVISGKPREKKKAIAITFDDGWADNAKNAFPLLEEMQLPASVFLPTSYIGTSQLFWPDALALQIESLANCTERTNSIIHRVEEGVADRKVSALISRSILCRKEERQSAIDPLIEVLKFYDESDRRECLSLMTILSKEFATLTYDPQFLDWETVKKAHSRGTISFGSHGHKHHILSELSPEQVNDDVQQSVQVFRKNDINPLEVFCYPNQNRNIETDKIIENAGFTYSLGSINDNEDPEKIALPCFQRRAIHEDVSRTEDLLALRLWLR